MPSGHFRRSAAAVSCTTQVVVFSPRISRCAYGNCITWSEGFKRMICGTLPLPFVDLIQGSTDAGIGSIHHVAQHFPHGKAWQQNTDSPLQTPRQINKQNRKTHETSNPSKGSLKYRGYSMYYGLMIQFHLNQRIEPRWISNSTSFSQTQSIVA